MGIYDRDYYRDGSGSWFSRLTQHGQVVTWLVVINIIVYIAQIATRVPYERGDPDLNGEVGYRHFRSLKPNSGPVSEWLDLSCKDVIHGQVWRLVTHAFLHSTDDFWHIVMNMLLLWWFGRY